MSQPMETGLRKDKKTGKKIPPNHITEVTAEHDGNVAMTANCGGATSQNPYLSFKFTGAASGDKITITWVDNMGMGDSAEAAIK